MARLIIISCMGLLLVAGQPTSGGLIKDVFQKITNTGNKTEDVVKQSAPICGSGAFSTPNESSISPEIIFITDRPSRSKPVDQYERSGRSQVNEVANEFRFHFENITIEELERHGFNREAPVSFLMHGFTSGYPLQAWLTAIVEAYTIDRETSPSGRPSSGYSSDPAADYQGGRPNDNYDQSSNYRRNRDTYDQDRDQQRNPKRVENSNYNNYGGSSQRGPRLKHNLFIINWNYAARGILYPRAVANIPIVASYVTRFINDKLLDEAGVDPRRIQLIGHSLGAHLAGFIGKNTRSKLGRIYGLDPAGPCFGSISGPLYPASKRLAPIDAQEVITVHTNSALLGIDKPLGRYSIWVEGGATQPGCKGGGILKSIGTITWDGGDFDTIACSHSRAPNLLTYRHDLSDTEDDCQMVAYECKDWQSFQQGHCGVCAQSASSHPRDRRAASASVDPMQPVQCKRLGLDWQYPKGSSSGSSSSSSSYTSRAPFTSSGSGYTNQGYTSSNDDDYYSTNNPGRTSTRRPYSSNSNYGSGSTSGYGGGSDNNYAGSSRRPNSSRRPYSSSSSGNNYNDRAKRYANSSEQAEPSERRASDDSVRPINMYLKTGDTQPYCAYHYQVILELNEPFKSKKPPMSIVLQDSEPDDRKQSGLSSSSAATNTRREQTNSLTNDEFGNRYSERIYTHLLVSNKKLKRIDHGTMIFREGLPDGHRVLKALHVNYMSHSNPQVRSRLSSRLCPVKTDTDRDGLGESKGGNRFYFKPCDGHLGGSSGGSSGSGNSWGGSSGSDYNSGNSNNDDDSYHSGGRTSTRRPYSAGDDNNNGYGNSSGGRTSTRRPYSSNNSGYGSTGGYGNNANSNQNNNYGNNQNY